MVRLVQRELERVKYLLIVQRKNAGMPGWLVCVSFFNIAFYKI